MNLEKSKTWGNLAKAFAGECQAGARYQLAAEKAEMEGYFEVAQLLKVLAKNEMAHARVFYNFITENGTKKVDNIDIEAGYPYKAGELAAELAFAAENEQEEAEEIYPEFGRIAEKEGFGDISMAFKRISQVETSHQAQLTEVSQLLKNQTMYKKDQPTDWKCSNCGHEGTSKVAWKKCPLCQYEQGYVEIPLESLN